MIQTLLAPLTPLYAAAMSLRNRHYDRAVPRRLRWPVVSVGGLSAGGAGKTPLVIHLAAALEAEGFHVDTLSRGYGRKDVGVVRADPAGSAEQYGDEPMLIARAGTPVYLGASRYEAGLLAERDARSGPRVHLLDDGFQHRRLGRDLDIVLVREEDARQRLLPAGYLREPLTSLRRADVIALRDTDARFEEHLRRMARADCRFWRVRRSLDPPPPGRLLAFCALASPEDFLRGLRAAGGDVVEAIRFRDHHRYTKADAVRIARLAARAGVSRLVTTEKDAVKLDAGLRAILEQAAPLHVSRLQVEIEDGRAAIAGLAARLRALQPREVI